MGITFRTEVDSPKQILTCHCRGKKGNRLAGHSLRHAKRFRADAIIGHSGLIKSAKTATKLKPNQYVSLKLFKMKPYPQTYTNVVVRDDGSSYRVWAGVEPHSVIAFPMDVSRMTDIEQQRIRMMRTGEKIKPGITIDVSIDDDDDSVGDEVFELKKKRTRKKKKPHTKKKKKKKKKS